MLALRYVGCCYVRGEGEGGEREGEIETDRPTKRESHHLYTCTNTLLYISSPLCIVPFLDAGSIHL